MYELWLDGNKLEPREHKSWGEALEDLESRRLGEGRLIQSITFDGSDQRDFRSPEVVDKRVDELGRVDVVSVDVTDYVRELIAHAPKHVDQVGQVLADAIALYRQNLPRDGAKRLHSTLLGLDVLMKLIATVSTSAQWDLGAIEAGDNTAEQELSALSSALEDVVRLQERSDPSALADVLEKTLVPRLTPWSLVFTEMDRILTTPVEDPSSGASAEA